MKALFMCVDAQNDFIMKDGSLSIEGAEEILPSLKRLTDLAVERDITVINTADCHNESDEELSDNPDFTDTFPNHCIKNTNGAQFVDEVKQFYSLGIPFNMTEKAFESYKNVIEYANEIVLTKKHFDISTNSYAEQVLEIINPDVVFVYGVAANVCVDFAVKFLLKLGYKVHVVVDAVKEISWISMDDMVKNWVESGVDYASAFDYSSRSSCMGSDYPLTVGNAMFNVMPKDRTQLKTVDNILDNMEKE